MRYKTGKTSIIYLPERPTDEVIFNQCLDDFIHHTTKQKKLQEFLRSFFIMVYFLSIYHNFSQIL